VVFDANKQNMNKKKTKAWIEAARLRTLPLSISGILAGSAVAWHHNLMSISVFVLLLLTTIALQVLSNMANDLGDYQHGADTEERVGPQRGLQGGVLSEKEMRIGVIVCAIVSFLVGVAMLAAAFIPKNEWIFFGCFVAFGILTIIAALKYTMGKNPYGYSGKGDLMVFIFFGLATVAGSYIIHSASLNLLPALLPAISIGLFSMGVLNVNNLRDNESDKKTGKNTQIVKHGVSYGQRYHLFLCVGGIASMLVYFVVIQQFWGLVWIAVPSFIILKHALRIFNAKEIKAIDPELKKLSLSTLLMAILMWCALI